MQLVCAVTHEHPLESLQRVENCDQDRPAPSRRSSVQHRCHVAATQVRTEAHTNCMKRRKRDDSRTIRRAGRPAPFPASYMRDSTTFDGCGVPKNASISWEPEGHVAW
jgi:hypothetical protein